MSDDRERAASLLAFAAIVKPDVRWLPPGLKFFTVKGEVYAYVSDHPLEECVYKPLYH